MGYLSKMTEKATKEWANNLTLEQIEEYERQGMDMSEHRINYEARQAEKRRLIEANIAAIDMGKLDKYKRTPRNAEDDFVNAVAQFNGVSDKKKQSIEDAPLVYGRVVQAHQALFNFNEDSFGAAGIVFLYALDETHRYDEKWLAKTAKRIMDMKEEAENNTGDILHKICKIFSLGESGFLANILETNKLKCLPEDCREFIRTLRDSQSSFCFPLGESLNEGADAWCTVCWISKPSQLPKSQIPYSRIIPLLVPGQPKKYKARTLVATVVNMAKDHITELLIPPTYYTK